MGHSNCKQPDTVSLLVLLPHACCLPTHAGGSGLLGCASPGPLRGVAGSGSVLDYIPRAEHVRLLEARLAAKEADAQLELNSRVAQVSAAPGAAPWRGAGGRGGCRVHEEGADRLDLCAAGGARVAVEGGGQGAGGGQPHGTCPAAGGRLAPGAPARLLPGARAGGGGQAGRGAGGRALSAEVQGRCELLLSRGLQLHPPIPSLCRAGGRAAAGDGGAGPGADAAQGAPHRMQRAAVLERRGGAGVSAAPLFLLTRPLAAGCRSP